MKALIIFFVSVVMFLYSGVSISSTSTNDASDDKVEVYTSSEEGIPEQISKLQNEVVELNAMVLQLNELLDAHYILPDHQSKINEHVGAITGDKGNTVRDEVVGEWSYWESADFESH